MRPVIIIDDMIPARHARSWACPLPRLFLVTFENQARPWSQVRLRFSGRRPSLDPRLDPPSRPGAGVAGTTPATPPLSLGLGAGRLGDLGPIRVGANGSTTDHRAARPGGGGLIDTDARG